MTTKRDDLAHPVYRGPRPPATMEEALDRVLALIDRTIDRELADERAREAEARRAARTA